MAESPLRSVWMKSWQKGSARDWRAMPRRGDPQLRRVRALGLLTLAHTGSPDPCAHPWHSPRPRGPIADTCDLWTVATLDHRHFSILRFSDGSAPQILP